MNKYIDLSTRISVNESRLASVVTLAKSVMDNIISSETEGLLKKPTTAGELEEFNTSVNELVTNKLRNRLGV